MSEFGFSDPFSLQHGKIFLDPGHPVCSTSRQSLVILTLCSVRTKKMHFYSNAAVVSK